MKWIAIFSCLFAGLTAFGGIWAAFKQEKDKATDAADHLKFQKWLLRHPASLVLLGSLLGAGASVWGVLLQENEKRADKVQVSEKEKEVANQNADFERELRSRADAQLLLQRELADKSDENSKSQSKLREKSDKIAEAQVQLRKKSDEIASLNKEIAEAQVKLREKSDEIVSTVTGGNSYCRVILSKPIGNLEAEIILFNVGRFPVYDVIVYIADSIAAKKTLDRKKTFDQMMGKKEQLAANTFSDYLNALSSAIKTISIGTLASEGGQLIGELKLPYPEKASYTIHIIARNGTVVQQIEFLRVNGNWETASRIYFNDKLIKEEVDNRFPRNAIGQVEWE